MYSHAHTVSSIKSLISHIALCVCGDCSCQNKCAVNYISLDVLVADNINSSSKMHSISVHVLVFSNFKTNVLS